MFWENVWALKREEVRRRKGRISFSELERRIRSLPPPRPFMEIFKNRGGMAIIAEIKRASPSAGWIRKEIDIPSRAAQYEAAGASAISVLTERNFFGGELRHLRMAKENSSLPILQKDFILDPYQVYEGRFWGADAILLIASRLEKSELEEFVRCLRDLSLTPFVEIHGEEDLEKIAGLGLPILGINNRDLKSLQVDLGVTLRLIPKVPRQIKVVSESGIRSGEEVRALRDAGVKGILVGEVLMRASDAGPKLRELLRP